MRTDEFITESAVLDDLLAPFADAFARPSDFAGYRNHCLRMLNVALALSDAEPDRREKLEIALAFHDITVFPSGTLDYLNTSAALARRHLEQSGRDDWSREVTLMISAHHKITPYRGPYENLVDAVRMADWIDISFGILSFGLSRDWLRGLHRRLPLHTFYPRALLPLVVSYMVRHPRRPLPNFRL